MQSCAPGKLILSGEHSVVYGAPAIAVAVEQYVQIDFETGQHSHLDFEFSDFNETVSLASDQLEQLARSVDARFQAFEQDQLAISQVLSSPAELLASLISEFSRPSLHGKLRISSTIPVGAGMGSSAAVIAAALVLIHQLNGEQPSVSDLIAQIRYIERLQHGKGSAIDASAVAMGGMIRLQQGVASSIDGCLGEGWFQVYTGQPLSGTGECVEQVRKNYGRSNIWTEFTEVTDQLVDSLGNFELLLEAVRHNHRLLNQIGVVPAEVNQFIDQVQLLGGAAKVSGAGAVRGDAAGMVLLCMPESDPVGVCKEFGYPVTAVKVDKKGARIVSD